MCMCMFIRGRDTPLFSIPQCLNAIILRRWHHMYLYFCLLSKKWTSFLHHITFSVEDWGVLLCSLKLKSHAENRGEGCFKDKRVNILNECEVWVWRQNVDVAFKILNFSSSELILSFNNQASTVLSNFRYWS